MENFTILPAIDLRQGQVVRLSQGDPDRQTVYDHNPGATARRWLDSGARWLHVVNLDGAFGENDSVNLKALASILQAASEYQAQVQFGGGLRALDDVRRVLEMGVMRAVLGTVIIKQPEILSQSLHDFGSQHIAAGLDARDGLVRVHGWKESTLISARDLALRLSQLGLVWMVFTDVARDGMGGGFNLQATVELAGDSGLRLIASGGVEGPEDVQRARQAGLAGIIIGRALYEGKIELDKIIHTDQ